MRQAAVEALGDLGDPQVAGALTGLFRSDSRRDVRREIARALKNFPASPEGLGVLLEAVLDADAGIRHEASHSLSEFFAREERIFRGSMLKKREVVTALLKVAGRCRTQRAKMVGARAGIVGKLPGRDSRPGSF